MLKNINGKTYRVDVLEDGSEIVIGDPQKDLLNAQKKMFRELFKEMEDERERKFNPPQSNDFYFENEKSKKERKRIQKLKDWEFIQEINKNIIFMYVTLSLFLDIIYLVIAWAISNDFLITSGFVSIFLQAIICISIYLRLKKLDKDVGNNKKIKNRKKVAIMERIGNKTDAFAVFAFVFNLIFCAFSVIGVIIN